jgi:hypothetical protein
MNDSFVTEFVKTAIDFGVDDDTIVLLFKRAMEDPQLQNMFKQNLGNNNSNQETAVQPDQPAQLQQLEELQQLVQQNPQLLVNLQQYSR